MKRAFVAIVALALVVGACVGSADVSQQSSTLTEGTADAVGLVRLLNDPSTTFAMLDDDVPLDRRAATNLMANRPYSTVAQVDAVKYVGVVSLARLIEFARARGFVPTGDDVLGSYDGVSFTVDQAEAALRVVNEESEGVLRGEVKLYSRAVASILAARPVASMDELAGLYWVGRGMLERLRTYVAATIAQPGQRADCRHDGECDAGERCGGRVEQGGVGVGKCYPTESPVGYWNECSDTVLCNADLFCSGLTLGNVGWCSPMWMQDTFTNDTQRFIPQDGSVVATSVVVYGQASVPMDIVVDLQLSHSNPADLWIAVYDPNGTEAVLWNGPAMGGAAFPTSFVALGQISRDDEVNGRWLLRVKNVGGSGTGNLHNWQMWITSRFD